MNGMSSVASTLLTNATGPASASSDAGSVSQHNLKDQIAADKYLDANAKATASHRGLIFTKLTPPGAV